MKWFILFYQLPSWPKFYLCNYYKVLCWALVWYFKAHAGWLVIDKTACFHSVYTKIEFSDFSYNVAA